MNTKTRESYEPRLVSEFVLTRWPVGIHMFDVPLGPLPPNPARTTGGTYAAGISRPSRPRVDALVIDTGTVYVIEGKIMDVSLGAGKLPMYERLVPETPELQAYKDLPRVMVLVSANPAQWSAQDALRQNITLVIYQPDWVKNYIEYRNTYFTADSRRARQARKDRLVALGYGKEH